MSLKEEFEENRGIIVARAFEVDLPSFEKFAEKYGRERALGYLMAMADFGDCLDKLLLTPTNNGFSPETPARVRTKTSKLHGHIENFLSGIKASGWLNVNSSTDHGMQGGPT